MNLEELRQHLICTARAEKPSDKVPYAFEQRILHRLKSAGTAGELAAGAGASLWRAAACCLVVTSLVAGWSVIKSPPVAEPESFSQAFENSIYAAVDLGGESEDAW